MDFENLPVVKVTEKSLRRLKEKIEKLHLEKNPTNEGTKKTSSKSPKFEVYRPGVSRLSNRSVSSEGSSFSAKSGSTPRKETKPAMRDIKQPKFPNNSTRNKLPFEKRESSRQAGVMFENKSKQNRNKGRSSRSWKKSDEAPNRNTSARQNDTSEESYDEDEEGFLARHERRRRRRGYEPGVSSNENSDHETKKKASSDDEFIWDDYHGDFLKNWPEEDYSASTPSDHVVEPSPELPKQRQVTSETPPLDATSLVEEAAKPPDRGLLIRIPENIPEETVKDSRKQLFNPYNPEIPIMVRPNLRDKNITKKKTSGSSRQPVKEGRQMHDQRHNSFQARENFPPSLSVDDTRQDPSMVSNKYASHSNHWNAPISVDIGDFDGDKSADQHDVLSSGISDCGSNVSHDKLLKDAEQLEITISNMLSPRQFSFKLFNEKLQITRTELKQIYKSLILHHIEVASKQNVEQMLWKTVYHQLLEQLRKQITSASGEEKNDLKNLLVVVLDQATEFYENLLMRLQQMYKIDLKEFFTNVSTFKQFQKRIGKRTKLALMSCQRSLICLGDISRYKENANETSNFGRARQYYIQARSLEPRNGRPYNQLALLAVHTRRKLDAIYYYARSLATLGTPILTARESLIALFDDARRKYQKTVIDPQKEKERSLNGQERTAEDKTSLKKRPAVKSPRMFWIHPDQDDTLPDAKLTHDVTNGGDKQSGDSVPPSSMTKSQLLRHFTLVFTHVHGKLFTRVGLDTFEKLKDDALDLFDRVLSSEDPLISKQTLLHMFAINFFTVFDQKQRQKTDSSDSSWLYNQSLQIALSMIAILTRHVTSWLCQLPTSPAQVYDPTMSKQLTVMLPTLKVAYDWMYSNKPIWYPTAPPRPCDLSRDVWTNLALLCDWLIGDYKKFPMRIFNQNLYNLEEVCLPEDSEFAGFAPLANYECESRYVLISEHTSMEQRSRAAECVRLDLIRDFIEYLCGMEQPLLAFKQGRYVVLIENAPAAEETKSRLSSANDDVINDWVDEPLNSNVAPQRNDSMKHDDEVLNELVALRDSLQQTKYDHDRRKDQIISSLEETPDGDVIRVKPHNLIPDTNCFIDHLDVIKTMVGSGVYTIYVPLVVLVELQGLGQDSKGSDEHSLRVYNRASSAIEYLKRKFTSERDTKVQALTNQGSTLHTISFQSQSDSGSKATNDDLILQCCVKFEEKSRSKSVVKTVLLSDDRNLRVKALTMNMPTKSLSEFCKWANIGRT